VRVPVRCDWNLQLEFGEQPMLESGQVGVAELHRECEYEFRRGRAQMWCIGCCGAIPLVVSRPINGARLVTSACQGPTRHHLTDSAPPRSP
jgi:hypothetical protein